MFSSLFIYLYMIFLQSIPSIVRPGTRKSQLRFENKEKDRIEKSQLAVLSIFCLVYPHSQSFWKWCISHLLKIEEEEDSR